METNNSNANFNVTRKQPLRRRGTEPTLGMALSLARWFALFTLSYLCYIVYYIVRKADEKETVFSRHESSPIKHS